MAPFQGLAAIVWAAFWWLTGAAITHFFWPFFERTPFLVFFPVAGIVAARSGPVYGILTAFIAFGVVTFHVVQPLTLLPAAMAMLLACAVISYLAYYSRRLGKIAEAQKAVIEHDREKLFAVERALRAEAENANRSKDEFLATLSHELRTPLNAILGWATVIAATKADAQIAEAARVIQRNANAQAQLIDDLLDLNRIIAGKLRLEVQPVDIQTVITNALTAHKPQMEQKNLRLTCLLDAHVQPLRGDPARLQQVLSNLLTNAIKYTPPGGSISVALERINSHVEISVSDTGKGIAPEHLPHVFEKFMQARQEGKRDGGLGIGLTISRHLVTMHGGSIQAKSSGEGLGSTFRVSLPVPAHSEEFGPLPDRAHPSSTHDSTDAAPPAWDIPVMKGLSVLIVEDDADSRTLLAHIFTQANAEVTTASSAIEALQIFETLTPDLIVSDIGMPGMDGFEFMRQVRQLKPVRDIFTIAVTAFARPEDRRTAMLSGFDFFVSKPLDPGEFSAVLHRAITRQVRANPATSLSIPADGEKSAASDKAPSIYP